MLLYWSVLATQIQEQETTINWEPCFSLLFLHPSLPFLLLYLSDSLMLGRSRCGFLHLCDCLMYCSNSEAPPGGNHAPLKRSEPRTAERKSGSGRLPWLKTPSRKPWSSCILEIHKEKWTVSVAEVNWDRRDEWEYAMDDPSHILSTLLFMCACIFTHILPVD